MPGAIVIAVILVVVIPVAVMMTGAVVAGIIGQVLKRDGEVRYDGSELLELTD